MRSPKQPGRDALIPAAAGRRHELPGAGSDVLSEVSPCCITLGASFPACHFFSGRRIISPRQMHRGRNTRLFAMQFIKTCFRGGLREHWLEMLIIISNNVLTCLLPYPAASGDWRGAPAGISVCFSRAFPPLPPSAPPLLCRAECITASRRRRNFLPVEKQLVGGEGRGKESLVLFIFYFTFFFFLDLVVVLLGEGSNLTSVETNDTARLPCCLLLLRQKRGHYFSPSVLDFCKPKGLEDFNGLSQRLRGPLYVKPQSHPRRYWPLFDFMKLILDRWYFYSSCLASPMAILM